MNKNEFGIHTVCSLYYDTDLYDIIRTSVEKPVYKEKLRLRSYGTPKKDDLVLLEIKKKFDGIVYKRRITLTLEQAHRYLTHHIKPGAPSQILDEIDWFMQRYDPQPKVVLCCERQALYGKDDPDFRVTFDFDIRWRDYALDLSKGSFGTKLISGEHCLMEVKTEKTMPMWLVAFLAEKEIFPQLDCPQSLYQVQS